jgi:hypothetical protein
VALSNKQLCLSVSLSFDIHNQHAHMKHTEEKLGGTACGGTGKRGFPFRRRSTTPCPDGGEGQVKLSPASALSKLALGTRALSVFQVERDLVAFVLSFFLSFLTHNSPDMALDPMAGGIALRNRKYRLRTYRQCFGTLLHG